MTKYKSPRAISYPFDLSEGLREAAGEICGWIPDLAHIDVSRVQFALFHTRQAQQVLTFARCYPLTRESKKVGRSWHTLEPVYTPMRRKARYILAFAWKRYWEQPPRKRLETLVHELYHISPRFDGEFRSFDQGGPHGPGLRWFDRQVRDLMNTYVPEELEYDFPALSISVRSGLKVTGQKLQVPKWQKIVLEENRSA